MEAHIQNLTEKQSAAGSRGIKLPNPAAALETLLQQHSRLVQLPKTSMIWVNNLVQPLEVNAGDNSGPFSAEGSADATLPAASLLQKPAFINFPNGIAI